MRRNASHEPIAPEAPADTTRIVQLEQELDILRAELQSVIRDLEASNEDLKAINEEAMSVNEEFQSTNEELETSKEELQSLNEELTALNTQLQETVEQHRATSNDLQNILDSSDLATIFLDGKFNIRFFTPATKSLVRVIASDIGRPLADLRHRFGEADLLADARAVLASLTPLRREIEADDGTWYIERVLPVSHPLERHRGRGLHLRRHLRTEGRRAGNPDRARLLRQHRRHRSPAADRARRRAARRLGQPRLLPGFRGRAGADGRPAARRHWQSLPRRAGAATACST